MSQQISRVTAVRFHTAIQTFSVPTSVDDAALAVDRLAGYVVDVGARTSSSRLSLNSSKKQVTWLGYKNLIGKINIRSVPVLSSVVNIVDSARDLGDLIDRRLTRSNQVTALCRVGYYQLRHCVQWCVRWLDHCQRNVPKH